MVCICTLFVFISKDRKPTRRWPIGRPLVVDGNFKHFAVDSLQTRPQYYGAFTLRHFRPFEANIACLPQILCKHHACRQPML